MLGYVQQISKCLNRSLMLRLCHVPFPSCCVQWLLIHFALIWEDCTGKGYPVCYPVYSCHEKVSSSLDANWKCFSRLYSAGPNTSGMSFRRRFFRHSWHQSDIPVVYAWLSWWQSMSRGCGTDKNLLVVRVISWLQCHLAFERLKTTTSDNNFIL